MHVESVGGRGEWSIRGGRCERIEQRGKGRVSIEATMEIRISGVGWDRVDLSPEDADVLVGLLAGAGGLPVRLVFERSAVEVPRQDEGGIDLRKWRCGEAGCGWTGDTEDERREHQMTEHGDGGFPCDEPGCDFRAVSEHGLVIHQKAKHSGETFPCREEGCEFVAQTEAGRASHERSHGDVAFPCEHDGCSFVGDSKSALHGHSHVHKAESRGGGKRLIEKVQDRWLGSAKENADGPRGRYATVEEDA